MAGKKALGSGVVQDMKVKSVNNQTVIEVKLRLKYTAETLVAVGDMTRHSVDMSLEASQEEMDLGGDDE